MSIGMVPFLFCPAQIANPVFAPHPVHEEENPIRKGVSDKHCDLKEATGG